jgi:hypothetical protein
MTISVHDWPTAITIFVVFPGAIACLWWSTVRLAYMAGQYSKTGVWPE